MKYQVRLTKRSFYGAGESLMEREVEAVSDQGARKAAWQLGFRTEVALSGSMISKVEVQINGVWEQLKRDPSYDEKIHVDDKTEVKNK